MAGGAAASRQHALSDDHPVHIVRIRLLAHQNDPLPILRPLFGTIGIEDLDDIGMAEARRSLCLTAKTAHRLLVLQAIFADYFDGENLPVL